MTPELKEKYTKLLDSTSGFRGAVITQMVYLESCIDEYISRHFCATMEAKLDFFDFLLNKLSLSEKKTILSSILAKKFPELAQPFPLIENIEFLIKHRNQLAHRLLDTSEKAINSFNEKGIFQLMRFNGDSNHSMFVYTNEMITPIFEKAASSILELRKMIGLKNPEES